MALSKDNVGKQVIYNDTEKDLYITGKIVRYYKDEDNNEEFYMVSLWPSKEVVRFDDDTHLTII